MQDVAPGLAALAIALELGQGLVQESRSKTCVRSAASSLGNSARISALLIAAIYFGPEGAASLGCSVSDGKKGGLLFDGEADFGFGRHRGLWRWTGEKLKHSGLPPTTARQGKWKGGGEKAQIGKAGALREVVRNRGWMSPRSGGQASGVQNESDGWKSLTNCPRPRIAWRKENRWAFGATGSNDCREACPYLDKSGLGAGVRAVPARPAGSRNDRPFRPRCQAAACNSRAWGISRVSSGRTWERSRVSRATVWPS